MKADPSNQFLGVWSHDDLDHILRRYGAFIVEREGTDIDEALSSLVQWRDNIYVCQTLSAQCTASPF